MDNCTNLESVLNKLNNFITLKQEDRKKYTEDFDRVRNFLLNEMKEADKIFGKLYKGPCLAGSYADNLKVSKPDEFDLVFHLKLPDYRLVNITKDSKKPGNVLINMNPLLTKIETEQHNKDLHAQISKFVNKDGYLLQAKFQSWIQSIITKILINCSNTYKCSNEVYKLEYARTGPAHTITVNQGNRKFSIDFVPGIIFDKETWPAKRKCSEYARCTNWIAVPKPIKENPDNISFQSSFVDTEREIILDKKHLKNCLRMFKKLRDKLNTQNLKSYYIKTVFLWETDVKPKEFWSQNSLSYIFMHMFEQIVRALEIGKLLFFWDKSCNMFSGFTKPQLDTMRGQWNAAYQKCLKLKDTEPAQLLKSFLSNEEMQYISTQSIKEAKGQLAKNVSPQPVKVPNNQPLKVPNQSKQMNSQPSKVTKSRPTEQVNAQTVKQGNAQPVKVKIVNPQPVKITNNKQVKQINVQTVKKVIPQTPQAVNTKSSKAVNENNINDQQIKSMILQPIINVSINILK